MTCLQHLQHSLACTAWQQPSARKQGKGVEREKEQKVPWQVEHVQHCPPPKDQLPGGQTVQVKK